MFSDAIKDNDKLNRDAAQLARKGLEVMARCEEQLLKLVSVLHAFSAIEMPSLQCQVEMQSVGFPINCKVLHEYKRAIQYYQTVLEKEAAKLAEFRKSGSKSDGSPLDRFLIDTQRIRKPLTYTHETTPAHSPTHPPQHTHIHTMDTIIVSLTETLLYITQSRLYLSLTATCKCVTPSSYNFLGSGFSARFCPARK